MTAIILLDDAPVVPEDCPPGYIADHEDIAVNRWPSELRKPNNTNTTRIYTPSVQEIEDNGCVLEVLTRLENAQGAQLDLIGAEVGEGRGNLGDDDYRGFISARISINGSLGEIERIISIIDDITRVSPIQYIPMYPMGHRFQIVSDFVYDDDFRARLNEGIDQAAPSGVLNGGVVRAATGFFGFDGDPDAVPFGQGPFPEVL